jgi:hypothetical protein
VAAVGEAVTVGVVSAAVVAVGVEVTAVGVAVAGADRPLGPEVLKSTGVNREGPRLGYVPTAFQTPLDSLPVHFADVQESDDNLNC